MSIKVIVSSSSRAIDAPLVGSRAPYLGLKGVAPTLFISFVLSPLQPNLTKSLNQTLSPFRDIDPSWLVGHFIYIHID